MMRPEMEVHMGAGLVGRAVVLQAVVWATATRGALVGRFVHIAREELPNHLPTTTSESPLGNPAPTKATIL
jgi:hypothetical protein